VKAVELLEQVLLQKLLSSKDSYPEFLAEELSFRKKIFYYE
jgi:hypothetical protein